MSRGFALRHVETGLKRLDLSMSSILTIYGAISAEGLQTWRGKLVQATYVSTTRLDLPENPPFRNTVLVPIIIV